MFITFCAWMYIALWIRSFMLQTIKWLENKRVSINISLNSLFAFPCIGRVLGWW